MRVLIFNYLAIILSLLCVEQLHSMKRIERSYSDDLTSTAHIEALEGLACKKPKGQQHEESLVALQPTEAPRKQSAVDTVLKNSTLLGKIAALLSPPDFCRFAQSSKTIYQACHLTINNQEKYFVYAKAAEYLIGNFSNPINQVLKHTEETGNATINGDSFNAARLINMLQSMGAQICRIANHRRSQEMQACDGRVYYEWEPPRLKPIPCLFPFQQHVIDYGPWAYLSDSPDLTSPDAISSQDGCDVDETEVQWSDDIIESVEDLFKKPTAPVGVALDLTDCTQIITTQLLEQLAQFPVVSLALTNCKFDVNFDIEVFTKFTELRELFINGLNITDDGLRHLCTLKHLQALVLRQNNITALPAEISQLKELRYLNLQENPIDNLDRITTLTNLRFLVLTVGRKNQPVITTIPETIGNLKHLRVLFLNNNDLGHGALKTIDPAIGSLTYLKTLDLGGNHLFELPESMKELKRLKNFYIYANPIKFLPTGISQLPTLKTVNFFDANPGMRIPTSFLRRLASGKLQDLELSKTELTKICTLLEKKEALRKLLSRISQCDRRNPKFAGIFKALEMLQTESISIQEIKTLLKNLSRLCSLIGNDCSEQSCSFSSLEESRMLPAINNEWAQCLNCELMTASRNQVCQYPQPIQNILLVLAQTLHIAWRFDATQNGNPEIINALSECWEIMRDFYDVIIRGQYAITPRHLQNLKAVIVGKFCPKTYNSQEFDNIYNSLLITYLLEAIKRHNVSYVKTFLNHCPQLSTTSIEGLSLNLFDYVKKLSETDPSYCFMAM